MMDERNTRDIQEGAQHSEQATSGAPVPPRPVDTYSYRGWLNSDEFIKRALAVVGYSMVGQLIITLALIIIAVLLIALTTIG